LGGSDLDVAFKWLCDRVSGGVFLVLRAHGDDDYNPYINGLCKVNSVSTLILPDRAAAQDQLRRLISSTHTPLQAELLSKDKLNTLTELYEPFANALGHHFLMALPLWIPQPQPYDNWQTTSWGHIANPFAVSDPFLAEPADTED
jgi:hypothetical protein